MAPKNLMRSVAVATLQFWFVHSCLCDVIRCSDGGSNSIHDCELSALVNEFWKWRMSQCPELATQSGEITYGDQLESFSESVAESRQMKANELLEQARSISTSSLNTDDQITREVLIDQLRSLVDGYQWKDYGWLNPVNFMELLPPYWVSAYHSASFNSEQYLKRLAVVPIQVDQVIKLMQKAIALNRTNHAVSMRNVTDMLSIAQSRPANDSDFLYKPLLSVANTSEAAQRDLDSALEIITTKIQPALKRLADFIQQEYMPATRQSFGVGSMTNGLQYYQALLRWYLSTNHTPSEIHQLGLQEVDRIQKLMINVKNTLGHNESLTEFFSFLRQSPHHYNHTEEDYLNEFRQTLSQRIIPRLPQIFDNAIHSLPQVYVQRTPTDGIFAYYIRNTVMVNTRNPHSRPSFGVLTLSLHEGLPGHHLQISMLKLLNLPKFREYFASCSRKSSAPFNFPYYTSYLEGWGLYAEYLGEELGLFQNSAFELFSRYSYEIFRACRLVVDTGIHAFGWSREQAIDFMSNYTYMTRDQLATEIDRYITWPGQACSYKIGELKIKELRVRAQTILGNRFDVRSFHRAVLSTGPVSLSTLQIAVDQWIERQLTQGTSSGLKAATSSSLSLSLFSLLSLAAVSMVSCVRLQF